MLLLTKNLVHSPITNFSDKKSLVLGKVKLKYIYFLCPSWCGSLYINVINMGVMGENGCANQNLNVFYNNSTKVLHHTRVLSTKAHQ